MNNQKTTKTTRIMNAKTTMLVSVLLLAACDGGIFGTGGADDIMVNTPDLTSENLPNTDQGTSSSATGDAGDSNSTGAVALEGGTVGDSPTSPIDTGTGTTGAGTGDADASTFELSVSAGNDGTFVNATPTLSDSDAQLVVINTSSLTLDIVSRDTDQGAVIFEVADVAPNTSSESTTLSANVTNLTIAESNNPTQVLISYSQFIADPSTLTTLFIREDTTGINSVALVTETKTSGPGLAKVRIVQGGTLGDALVDSHLQLQSAGDNPGGVDINFGPLSFDRQRTDYIELFAGDYELIDLAKRFSPVAVTLSSESVYTLLLIGNGNDNNNVLTVIDSETP